MFRGGVSISRLIGEGGVKLLVIVGVGEVEVEVEVDV